MEAHTYIQTMENYDTHNRKKGMVGSKHPVASCLNTKKKKKIMADRFFKYIDSICFISNTIKKCVV